MWIFGAAVNIKNLVKEDIQALIYNVKKITKLDNCYEFVASNGTVIRMAESEIPAASRPILNAVAEAFCRKAVRVIDAILDSSIVNRVKEIRGLLPSELKSGGNLATAKVEILGLKSEFYAHSRIDVFADARSAADKVSDISLKPTNPIFEATTEVTSNGTNLFRDVDTEYKILNDIASQLGENVNIAGKIKLFTELVPCPSCDRVILEFLKKYKNITIEVIHNNGTRLIP